MKTETRRMAALALLSSLVFLLGLTPLGLIPLGFINVTALCLPIIVGTCLLGLKAGLWLGFLFGTVSLMSLLGMSMTPPSALAGALLGANPLLAVLMCYIPRLLIPFCVYGVYRPLVQKPGSKPLAAPLVAAIGSLCNTSLYLGLMLVFYKLSGLDSGKIQKLILGTGLIAGGSEMIVAALLCPPIVYAVQKTRFMPEI